MVVVHRIWILEIWYFESFHMTEFYENSLFSSFMVEHMANILQLIYFFAAEKKEQRSLTFAISFSLLLSN